MGSRWLAGVALLRGLGGFRFSAVGERTIVDTQLVLGSFPYIRGDDGDLFAVVSQDDLA